MDQTAAIRREALDRQGTVLNADGFLLQVIGDQSRARFKFGAEGVVQAVIDQTSGRHYQLKSFWEPTQVRYQRSDILTKERLANLNKAYGDALGGAPFAILHKIGPNTPFGVIMKEVSGVSWQDLHDNAKDEPRYPPPSWPPLSIRATWAYGLASAVSQMEARGFIHADLSPGNVLVKPKAPAMGDMALVDFDAFYHLGFPALRPECLGWNGYAAPEIRQASSIGIGSDRLGMAILIQEFLVVGDPDISQQDAYTWAYDQESELNNRRGDAHPLLHRKYPDLATLVRSAIQSPSPQTRPQPERFRSILRRIIQNTYRALAMPLRTKLGPIVITPWPQQGMSVLMSQAETEVDLSSLYFRIRATVQRRNDGSVDLVVHPGAELKIRLSENSHWEVYRGNQRIPVAPDMIFFDDKGKTAVRLTECKA